MQSQLKRVVLALALSSVAGVAAAQTFEATATVQNAVTIAETTPFSFGTLFATATALGLAAGAADNTYSQKLTLNPTTGVVSTATPGANVGPAIQSLGGGAAGAYSAPGLPSNATVVVAILDNDDTQADFTNAATVAAAECVYDTPEDARQDGRIVMSNDIGDPTIAFFCIDNFTSNRAGLLDAAGGTGYALGFGVTELTFQLGATLVAQVPATAITRSYEAGTYTASFDMEVRFP